MTKMFRTIGATALMLAASTSSVVGQDGAAQAEAAGDMAAEAPHLPADSMELGAKYIDWILDYRADSLWARFSDEMKENFGSVGDFLDRMGDLQMQIGTQNRVVSQRYWMRNGKPQFWHTAEFSEVNEPVVLRLVIEPDGTISGIGFNPESQNPPVDDPDQHGDDGS